MGFEDLTELVNEAVADNLGIPATWTPRESGPPVSLRAVWRRNHRVFDPDNGAMIQSMETTAWVRLADLPREPREDDLLSIDGRELVVASMEPDGQGGAVLVLQKAPAP